MRTQFEFVWKADTFENGVIDFMVNDGENVRQMLRQGDSCEEVKAADGPKVDEAKKDVRKRKDLK